MASLRGQEPGQGGLSYDEVDTSIRSPFEHSLEAHERERQRTREDVLEEALNILTKEAAIVYGSKSKRLLSSTTEIVMKTMERLQLRGGKEIIAHANVEFASARFGRREVKEDEFPVQKQIIRLSQRDFRVREVLYILGEHGKIDVGQIFQSSGGISYERNDQVRLPENVSDRMILTDHSSYEEDLYNKDLDDLLKLCPNQAAIQALTCLMELQFRKRLEVGRFVAELVDHDWDPEHNLPMTRVLQEQFGTNLYKYLEYRQSSPPQIYLDGMCVGVGMYDRCVTADVVFPSDPRIMDRFYGHVRPGEKDEGKYEAMREVFMAFYTSLSKALRQQDKVEVLPDDAVRAAYSFAARNEKRSDKKIDIMFALPTDIDDENLPPNMINHRSASPLDATDRVFQIQRRTGFRVVQVQNEESGDTENQIYDNGKFLIHQLHATVDGKLLQDQWRAMVSENKAYFEEILSSLFSRTPPYPQRDKIARDRVRNEAFRNTDISLVPTGEEEKILREVRSKKLMEDVPDARASFFFSRSWCEAQTERLKRITKKKLVSDYFNSQGVSSEVLTKAKYVVNLNSVIVHALNMAEVLHFEMDVGKTDTVNIAFDGRMMLTFIASLSPELQKSMISYYRQILEEDAPAFPDSKRGKIFVDILTQNARERAMPVSVNIALSWLAQTLGGNTSERFLTFFSSMVSDRARAKLVVHNSGGLFSQLGDLRSFITARLDYYKKHPCTSMFQDQNGNKGIGIRVPKEKQAQLQTLTANNGELFKKLTKAILADIYAFLEDDRALQQAFLDNEHQGGLLYQLSNLVRRER